MSDSERAAGMVGCWFSDRAVEIGNLFHVQGHDGAGRVNVLCLWEDGSENVFTVRAAMLNDCRRVA